MQPVRSAYPGVAGTVHAGVEDTSKVLKNTYLLLAATLWFSAAAAGVAMVTGMPPLNPFIVLAGYFGLLFATMKTRNSAMGLLFVFALTGFMGLTLGPIISLYLTMLPNGNEVVMTALGTTGAVFVGLSAYAIKSKRDFSFMGGFLLVGILGAFILGIVALLFNMPTLSLAVSGMFVLAMGGLILYQTSEIVRGGETNYIMATVTLYVSIYNLFTSLLHLLGVFGGDE
ncbi:Bax inhibitor-1/YccA family protein [Wenzhouxiangella sp. XN24]|uniref:Bax inhibitor-1/YccA family protein n=1 Tax=Wenzhouxiangella sp. XN24 TaxID=2713569 RepID=UPI0013EDD849|nr:Bax inhibitor-1/YccA family protein [Wenzhouxiangella sp. XN24]NGX16672.1 Bax inhibitor-1/YccA family protein [Wenzhouxiangella sp. XN24]